MKKRSIGIAAFTVALAIAFMFGTSFASIGQDEISAINKDIKEKGYGWVAGENGITRMSDQERWALLMHTEPPRPDVKPPANGMPAALTTLPAEFDWRNKDGANWDTPIRNQLGCGSCWAFGTVAIVEPRVKIDLGMPDYPVDLSEQQLVSCSGAGGCGGGSPQFALNYAQNVGIVPESCFPYSGTNQACGNICANWENKKVKVDEIRYCGWSEELMKQAIVENGPVSIIFLVYTDFYGYSHGIYQHTTNQTAGLHSISIVGYNDTGGYWICKNSWGSDWGENGYFRLSYSEDTLGWNGDGALWMYWTNTINGTDIVQPPVLLNATTDASGYVRSNTDMTFSVNADAASLKDLAAVTLDGKLMDGPLSGGVFEFAGTPQKLGCKGGRRFCEFTINASDEFNFSSTTTVEVGIADAAVNVQSPAQNGAYYNYTMALNYSAVSYEDPIDSCWYALDGGAPVSLPGCANATISNISLGSHNLSVYENDTANQQAQQDVVFFMDPRVSITLNSSVVWTKRTLKFPFAVEVTSAGKTQCIILDSANRTRFSKTIAASGIQYATLSENKNKEYLYSITCYVDGKAEASADFTVYFDSKGPAITKAVQSDYFNTLIVDVGYRATDNLAESMSCAMSPGVNMTYLAVVQNGTEEHKNITYDSSGTKRIRVQCTDTAGNGANYYFNLNIDTLSPVITIKSLTKATALNPDNTSNVKVNYGITDWCTRMSQVKYSVDSGPPVFLSTLKSGTFTARIPRGSHSIKLIATDLAQNSNSVTAYVTVN